MGVKGLRVKNLPDEPKVLNNVQAIIDDAKSKGFINGYEVDIESIVKSKGIILEKDTHMDSAMSGILTKDKEKDRWIIRVNAKHHIKRQRYTIAHEFAHYCLHKDDRGSFVDETIYFRKENNSSIEYNADEFAAELLMPKDLFIEAVKKEGIKKITDLADAFNVSKLAIEYRAQKLDFKIKSNER